VRMSSRTSTVGRVDSPSAHTPIFLQAHGEHRAPPSSAASRLAPYRRARLVRPRARALAPRCGPSYRGRAQAPPSIPRASPICTVRHPSARRLARRHPAAGFATGATCSGSFSTPRSGLRVPRPPRRRAVASSSPSSIRPRSPLARAVSAGPSLCYRRTTVARISSRSAEQRLRRRRNRPATTPAACPSAASPSHIKRPAPPIRYPRAAVSIGPSPDAPVATSSTYRTLPSARIALSLR